MQMLFDRFQLMHALLAENGAIYVHIGWDVSHYARIALDEIFGSDRFVNQIIWKRQTAHNDARQGSQHYGRILDCIFLYSKTDSFAWNQLHSPHDEQYLKTHSNEPLEWPRD
jgi:adenine-specific DNA-methyltransferase